MNFASIVESVISETTVAGGAESAFGSNVTQTATVFSGDHYAPGDARVPKSLYGGQFLTRYGMTKKKKKKKKKASK